MSSPQFLIQAAIAAREHARAPFSHFKVGAAIEDENGRIVSGCNIENATYGLTMCAERVALFKALSEGDARLTHIAVVAESETLTHPCGACRQLLWEFCGDALLTLANLSGRVETLSLKEIFPRPFDASYLLRR